MKNNKPKKFLRVALIISIVVAVVTSISFLSYKAYLAKATSEQAANLTSSGKTLRKFTTEELKKYDGTDPKLPIYLVLDGNVYDVTRGSEFYKVGGPYHYLAGKDSSFELHIVGGDIIKRKYPVIGRLVRAN